MTVMESVITVSSRLDKWDDPEFTARLDGEVAGLLYVHRDVIDSVYVLPEYRRRGVARALYEHAVAVRPSLRWDGDMTPAGAAFARATGWDGEITKPLEGKRCRDWLRYMRARMTDAVCAWEDE